MTIETVVQSDIKLETAGPAQPAASQSAGVVNGARELFVPTSVAETLNRVVGLARRTLGAAGAGILLAAAGGAVSTATSGSRTRRADELQIDHHEGPGFCAISAGQPAVSPELRIDSRWRFWSPQAADLGYRSVLSLPLLDGDPFGAVTLYSRHPSFFHPDAVTPGLVLAEQAAIAITVAVEREQLQRAADTRGVVAQAQGILMERYQITADQAFGVIKRAAAAFNQRLRLIAERISGDRGLSDLDLLALPHLAGPTLESGFSHVR